MLSDLPSTVYDTIGVPKNERDFLTVCGCRQPWAMRWTSSGPPQPSRPEVSGNDARKLIHRLLADELTAAGARNHLRRYA